MLKLRRIGIDDYSCEDEQRIGRIRFGGERPPLRLWNIIIHLTGGAPDGLV